MATTSAAPGILIEFGGLPGTGKSTLARRLAERTGAVLLRVDEIEAAMRRNGLTPRQTGIAAYSVAHDLAAGHLRRGMTVIADAVNPVEEARAGWRALAADVGAVHHVVEVCCPDEAEHRRRVDNRVASAPDIAGWVYPTWDDACRGAKEYQLRTDDRLVVDTTGPLDDSHRLIAGYIALAH